MKNTLIYVWIVIVALTAFYATCCSSIKDDHFQGSISVNVQLQSSPIYNLAEAVKATVMIDFTKVKLCGSASLLGRENRGNGVYRYYALTCYHVIESWVIKVPETVLATGEDPQSLRDLSVTVQNGFQDLPVVYKTSINNVECQFPQQDWAIISFDIPQKLQCALLGTPEQFKAIQPFEPIYAIGNTDGKGLIYRNGVIGSTHNVQPKYQLEDYEAKRSENTRPELYFRPYITGWYGDSGGAIYQKDGYLIGIICALYIHYGWGPDRIFMPNGIVAMKMNLVREILATQNKKLTTIED